VSVSGQLALAIALTVAALLVAASFVLVLRRALITRRDGIVECWLRRGPGGSWLHGLAEYRGAQLCWHRSLSLRLRPHAVFDRSDLRILSSRPATGPDRTRLGPGMVIAQCEIRERRPGQPAGRRVVELAMTPAALTGCLSWLEASPIYPIRRAS
jgi:Protein of unknown function (DUF2550)